MRKLLTLCTLGLFSLALVAGAEERRDDDSFYTIDEPTVPAVGGVAQGQVADPADRAAAPQVDAELAALRADHARAWAELREASLAATDDAARAAIEAGAAELKAAQQREELELLLSQAEARGDGAYAERLRAALTAERAPRPEPRRVHVVRDPQTGRVISEGGEAASREGVVR